MSQRMSRYEAFVQDEAETAARRAHKEKMRRAALRMQELSRLSRAQVQEDRSSKIDSMSQSHNEGQPDRFKLLCRKAMAILTAPNMSMNRKRKHSVSSESSSSSSPPPQPSQAKMPRMEDLLASKRTLPTIYCPKPKTPKGCLVPSKPSPKKIQLSPIEMALARKKEQEQMEIESRRRHEVLAENRKHREIGRSETFNLMRQYRMIQFNKAQEAKITGVFQGEEAPKKKKTRTKKQFWEKD